MSIPKTRVNTYVGQKNKASVDVFSKIYITLAWLIGCNRIPVVLKIRGVSIILTLAYSLILNAIVFYYAIKHSVLSNIVASLNLIEYTLCGVVAVVYWKKIRKFYDELIEFDDEIKSKWLNTLDTLYNFVQGVVTITFVVIFNICHLRLHVPDNKFIILLFTHLNHVWEIHFYSHLFIHIKLGLKCLRILLLSSYPINGNISYNTELESINFKDPNVINLLTNNSKTEVKKLLLLYNKIINAYDLLNAAIQWQLLIILATAFITILGLSYHAALNIINENYASLDGLYDCGVAASHLVPVITICVFGEKIHEQVLFLQTALYSRIYKNVFDKSSRSTAISLLSLTEIRSLSFSVFRMIDINVSLPFKIFGLLASYLVILLQFQKVISFDRSDK